MKPVLTLLFFFAGLLAADPSWAAPLVFCELATLPALPLASDAGERLSPDELLARLAESYRGLLEFGGESITSHLVALVGANSADAEFASPEKFFASVPGRDQRSVALNESLVRLGDWVLLEAEDLGLTQEMITTRLREVVRAHLGQAQEEQGRVEETREDRRQTGVITRTGYEFERDDRFPELGEAYRDESGMVWGDVVRDLDYNTLKLKHADALKYCHEIGAELPSRDDFIRLRQYMGAQPGSNEGYTSQILPGLKWGAFWSSSSNPNESYFASVFYADTGVLFSHDVISSDCFLRCVVRTRLGSAP